MNLLTDADVARFPLLLALEAICEALRLHASGQLDAPARLHGAGLTFTVGAAPEVFGFRVYTTKDVPQDDQLVAVWDDTGRLSGVIVGAALGVLRTSLLGAVATEVLAPAGASRLGLIGSGAQARAHALAVHSVRLLTQVLISSRDPQHSGALAAELCSHGLSARSTSSPEAVCEGSDLLTLATHSTAPVIQADWVRPGTHLCTLGPRGQAGQECPPELLNRAALLVTDSPAQLAEQMGEGWTLPVRALGDCLLAPPQRSPDDLTIFLSAGLSGSEVLLGQAVLAQS
jgi:alanine dehydrogenase